MDENDEVKVTQLLDDYYLVETPTRFIVYENLYTKALRTRRFIVRKSDEIKNPEDVLTMWTASLN